MLNKSIPFDLKKKRDASIRCLRFLFFSIDEPSQEIADDFLNAGNLQFIEV